MVYIYHEKKADGRTVLVKAETQAEFTNMLTVSDKYEYLGSLTDAEMSALQTTSFGVITA